MRVGAAAESTPVAPHPLYRTILPAVESEELCGSLPRVSSAAGHAVHATDVQCLVEFELGDRRAVFQALAAAVARRGGFANRQRRRPSDRVTGQACQCQAAATTSMAPPGLHFQNHLKRSPAAIVLACRQHAVGTVDNVIEGRTVKNKIRSLFGRKRWDRATDAVDRSRGSSNHVAEADPIINGDGDVHRILLIEEPHCAIRRSWLSWVAHIPARHEPLSNSHSKRVSALMRCCCAAARSRKKKGLLVA